MSRLRDDAFARRRSSVRPSLVLGFLVLPIVAIFARVPLHLLIDQLDDPIVRDALVLTAITNVIALGVIILLGHARGLLPRHAALPRPDARDHARRAPARAAADRGRHRPPGCVRRSHRPALERPRSARASNVVFTTTAVVLAICFVAGPFYVRQAIAVVRDARQGHPRRRARRRGGPAPPAH